MEPYSVLAQEHALARFAVIAPLVCHQAIPDEARYDAFEQRLGNTLRELGVLS